MILLLKTSRARSLFHRSPMNGSWFSACRSTWHVSDVSFRQCGVWLPNLGMLKLHLPQQFPHCATPSRSLQSLFLSFEGEHSLHAFSGQTNSRLEVESTLSQLAKTNDFFSQSNIGLALLKKSCIPISPDPDMPSRTDPKKADFGRNPQQEGESQQYQVHNKNFGCERVPQKIVTRVNVSAPFYMTR